MLLIEVVNEMILGEQPPIIYVHGKCQDFLRLTVALLPLIKPTNYSVSLKDLPFVRKSFQMELVLKNGKEFSTDFQNDLLGIELTRDQWTDVIITMATVSLEKSHAFLEFDWLIEDRYGFICESEG